MISLMNVIIDQANHQDLPFWMIQMNGSGCPPSLMLQHWIWSAVVPACLLCFPVGFAAAAVPNAIQSNGLFLHFTCLSFSSLLLSLLPACSLAPSFAFFFFFLLNCNTQSYFSTHTDKRTDRTDWAHIWRHFSILFQPSNTKKSEQKQEPQQPVWKEEEAWEMKKPSVACASKLFPYQICYGASFLTLWCPQCLLGSI